MVFVKLILIKQGILELHQKSEVNSLLVHLVDDLVLARGKDFLIVNLVEMLKVDLILVCDDVVNEAMPLAEVFDNWWRDIIDF